MQIFAFQCSLVRCAVVTGAVVTGTMVTGTILYTLFPQKGSSIEQRAFIPRQSHYLSNPGSGQLRPAVGRLSRWFEYFRKPGNRPAGDDFVRPGAGSGSAYGGA